MSTDFAIGVVGHPDRYAHIAQLCNTIHPEVLSMDTQQIGCGQNHLEVIRQLRSRTSGWCVVMEDDAEPVDGFRDQLAAALPLAPARIVSFYAGTGYPQNWQARYVNAIAADTSWMLCERLLHGVCYALHPSVVHDMTSTVGVLVNSRYGVDEAISKVALGHGWKVAYTNPSLVDHADEKAVQISRFSLGQIGGAPKRPRKAHKVGTRNTWTDSCVTIAR